ncbi:polysaccharide biosynthesis tyrosine autokinase [Methylocella tundrae]|uniref:Exopolysaccharide biosynthesis protein n=1 Tax=Methylocella tundrae TaxID=227605 RepID=A0A4U8YVM5_METTU|nr:polysaccharide biosynthesis tyrosine autokinase [Methylocella tundrae]WPP05087.1 polysaccharide biosynthesis tyrosine autokinase [Methylocella tundrae]VFU07394.1 Exopolysaccharide biosynthesis protein [Methylocella tundrae]
MLQINKRAPLAGQDSPKVIEPLLDAVQSATRIVRRQLPIVVVIMTCCVALAVLYLVNTPPKFTATGSMVIDTHKVQLLEKESVLGDAQIDASTVQTQVEMLKSDNVALAVIKKLRLIDDPEFVPPADEKSKGLFSFLFPAAPAKTLSEAEREQIALGAFDDRLTVTREGLTYVIDVGFTSLNPEKSALIVNTLVEAFVDDQMEAKYQAARRAGVWLADRIKELRSQAAAAEHAVVDFKKKNNIVDTGAAIGGGASASRMLINDQQLSELNTQLILSAAATAEAKARLERITAVMSQDIPDASITDALKSEVIIKLRQQYLELAQKEAIFSQRYGANHLATVNLRTQMQEIRHSIADEMRKIAEGYKSDYEIAKTREQSLRDSMASAVTQSQTSGQAQVQLRELTSSADAARTLYDSFLQRYMEAVQQKDAVPISETRLISPAYPPMKKSSPKTLITLLLALAGGGVLSFGFAYLREASDGVFRTSDQIEDVLRVNCLAMAPALKFSSPRGDSSGGDDKTLAGLEFLRNVVDAPFGRYAEAVRSVKIAADLNGALKSHKVIGLTSTLPNEGKSTLAANLAHLIADAGGNVILVDADLRSPSLSRWLTPDAPGLIDVVIGNISIDAAVATLPSTRLHFLAAGATAKLPHTNEILASAAMKSLIDGLRAKYDYIIVDLSPVAPIVDVRTTGHIIDTYVYVIEWGKTKVDVVERGLSEAQGVYDRLLGVVLNKVDMGAQSRYERYHGNHYYRKYYSKYGYLE